MFEYLESLQPALVRISAHPTELRWMLTIVMCVVMMYVRDTTR
jgi:hypothetical protein